MTAPPHPDDLKEQLAVRIQALAAMLIPDGQCEGSEWRGHGPDGAKWGVVIKGGKIGYYQNFGSGKGGVSALGLIRDAVCQGDPRRAYIWALKFLGDDVLLPPAMRPAKPPATRENVSTVTGLGQFIQAQEFAWDNPVGLYLQARGIVPDKFRRPLRALRFDPRSYHKEGDAHLPAMLAAIIDPTSRKHIALHRTYLGRDGNGWCKSKVVPAKKVLGSFQGGIIPLTRGASGKPFGKIPDGDSCLMAEGIENALTVAQWFPELRALSCIAVANMPQVALPPEIASVMLVRDRDGENAPVKAARDRAVTRWLEEGRGVSLWEPPADCKDANDYWREVVSGKREA